MIINIRGTTGSGKTTIVRGVRDRLFSYVEVNGVLGVGLPEAYYCPSGLGINRPLYVLGPYNVPIGGLDAVIGRVGVRGCISLFDKYVDKGHLIFEGLIISSMWGSIGTWLEKHKPQVIIGRITATLEECRASLTERQGEARDSKTQAAHYAGTLRVCEKAEQQGFRVESLNRDTAVETVLGWLA